MLYLSGMQDNKFIKEVAEAFKKARESLSLTQAEVADKAGMNVNYYARIERGEINLTASKMNQIAKVLKIKILSR